MTQDTMNEDPIYEKVRALLRKAESTPYPEEAEAFTAKAQELLTRYALDAARVEVDSATQSVPVVRRVTIEGTYATGRMTLLTVVGQTNRCRVLWDSRTKVAFIVGYGVDIDGVLLLWHSLMVQAEAAMAGTGAQVDAWGVSRTRSFRSSFWAAFSARIDRRLKERNAALVDEPENRDLLPVLANREAAVEETFSREFPDVRVQKTRSSNAAGWRHGDRAASQANLSPRHEVR